MSAAARKPSRKLRVRAEARRPKQARRPAAQSAPAQEAARPAPRPPLERLREAAAMAPKPLPRRAELEALFGADLSGVGVVTGPEASEALDAARAEAAAVEGVVVAREGAALPVLAHEVAHALQPEAPDGSAAEAEGEALAAEGVAARAEAAGALDLARAEAGEARPQGAALRGLDDAEVEAQVEPPRDAAEAFDQGTQEEAPEAGEAETQAEGEAAAEEETPPEGTGAEGALGEGADLGEDVPDEPAPTFEAPPMPEIEVDEEAARAAQEAAEEKLAAADDADALMDAFKDAPPSVKAMKHDALEGETQRLSQEEQASFDEEMPDFDAEMSGQDDLPAAEPVQTPEAKAAALEGGPDLPVPQVEADPTPTPAKADENRAVLDFLRSIFGFGGADELGRTFGKVKTSDTDVDTSAGEREKVPLEGGTDPQQVEDQGKAAREDAEAKRKEAAQAVLDGPGPERVQLQELKEERRLDPRAAPEIAATAQAEGSGATEFREKELDPVVVALFDQDHGAAMSESLSEARTEMKTAVDDRDRDRDAEVTKAEEERDRLNEEADEGQRKEVQKGREDVQKARQKAVDDQETRRKELDDQVETDRKDAEGEIDAKVRETEEEAGRKYDKAEEDAEAEVGKGEKKADDEKARQERESKSKSWWERATDWVAEQFDKLTKFINDVFDAVRSLVKDIIDKVKKAVVALIDAAANAIKSAIKGFGELLKKGVNAMLGEHFPGIAKALNDGIDAGVEVATKAVDAVADTLKKGITALLDALGKALDAILAAYQALANAALALAKAAITGDWAELAKMIVEPILRALGIDPQEFYALIGKAAEALGDIVDDPAGFVGNLIDAVVLGFRKFSDNIVQHLQKGVIGWLTGALGDIQIPEKFDLMGVLDLGRQILGLTAQMIRKVAVRILGEKAVERIEFFMGYVVELIAGGWAALWAKIKEDLGNLRDMIFDGIKEFVLTRIVIAGITWLASLFNPVGALVKLVMTVWNFLMFLKDQFMRIVEVAKTTISFMYDIAKGVIEGAALGIEKVLGTLVPIVIDLIAKLLGLGSVAGRVKRIIAKVQQRIEDAIVKLIRKVLAKFTGKKGGKGAKDGKKDAGADGAIMAPMKVSGGGQTHTLFIKAKGRDAVPTMRSEETRVETWLRSLTTADGLMKAYNSNKSETQRITPEQAAKKLPDVTALVKTALGEEDALDREADQEAKERAGGENKPGNDEEVAQAARKLKEGLEAVLKKLGLSQTAGLWSILEKDISANVHPQLHPGLRNVLSQFPAEKVSTIKSWADFRRDFLAKPPGTWDQPLAARGAIRATALSVSVLRDMRAAAIAQAQADNAEKAQGKLESLAEDSGTADEKFATQYLVTALRENGSVQADLRARLLSGTAASAFVDRGALAPVMKAIVKKIESEKAKRPEDMDVFEKVKTGTVLGHMEAASKGAGKEFRHWKDQGPNGERTGAPDGPHALDKMLTAGVSDRWKANRGHVSDQIRGISPGNHEWIPGQMASKVIHATAKHGHEADTVSGLSKLIAFQNKVRTPTSKLIFQPQAALDKLDRTFGYVSRGHQRSGLAYSQLSDGQKKEFYPSDGPAFGEQLRVLQAHAGGLDALSMAAEVKRSPLQAASDDWHRILMDRIRKPLDDNLLGLKEAGGLKEEILGHYRDTIWRGVRKLPPTKKAHFDAYYTSSDGQTRSYGELKAYAKREYDRTLAKLGKDIAEALT